MKIAADTNILFSFFWQESLTKKLLITSNLELISPEIALKELEKYSNEICNRLKINKKIFNKQFKELKKAVNFINKREYSNFIKEAEKFSPDKNDADFFALCLKNKCFLWSNDALLKKQEKIKVLSTREIIEILF